MFLKTCLVVSLSLVASAVSAADLNYEGSSTVGKFMADASKQTNGFDIKLKTKSESSGGERCAASGRCDMGGVARDVGEAFLNKGVVKTLIGKDAIAAIVNSENPVKALSSEQLRGIFTGKIGNWSGSSPSSLSNWLTSRFEIVV